MVQTQSYTQPTENVSNLDQSLFLKALRREQVARPPIWLMRQAGRYLPEYRNLRSNVKDFIAMCEDPSLACEVTLMPIKRFNLDAAIIFSDILLIGQAMGLDLSFVEDKGPIFSAGAQTKEQIEQLDVDEASDKLSFVSEAIKLTVKELKDTPLIGFCGSPWTVASYMVEQGSSKDFRTIKKMAWCEPQTLLSLLNKLSMVSIRYLTDQVRAGAKALMIFDSWGGVLSDEAFKTFSLDPTQTIIHALKQNPITKNIPIIFFAKGKHSLYSTLANCGADALSIDWTVPLSWVQMQTQDKVALQGNLDPTMLLAPPEYLKAQVEQILTDWGNRPGHIFNLGHGVLPPTDPTQVQRLIDWVHTFSKQG